MEHVMERYLTPAQQTKLLSTIRKHAAVIARRDFAWTRLLITTGMRIGEFSLMTLRDAEFAINNEWIYIPAAHRKGGKHDHRIPVTDPVKESLQALVMIHREMGGSGHPDAPLVLSQKHKAVEKGMSVRSYQARMDYWCREAGIEHASPHWMRHTRAMNVMRGSQARDPRGVVQALLGHSRITSTGVYTGVSKEELLQAVEAVDGRSKPRGYKVKELYEAGRGA